MVKLELSNEERDVALEVLKTARSDLRQEIAGTDSYDFRAGLKAKEAILVKVIDALAAAE